MVGSGLVRGGQMEEQDRVKQGPAQEKPRPLKSFEEKMEGVWTLQCMG